MLIIRLPKVTSTQDFAESVHDMLYEDFIVVAEEQTQARGRYRRSWYSPKGGLWFTYVKKNYPTEEVPITSLKVSLAIRNILSKYVDAKIRWPNDVVVNDRKISGVLIEAYSFGDVSTLFIGVGVDVNIESFPTEINATSLLIETKRQYDLDKLLSEIIDEINKYLSIKNNDIIIDEINKYLSIKNRKVVLEFKDKVKECISLFVDYHGRLVTDCGIYEVEEVLRVKEL